MCTEASFIRICVWVVLVGGGVKPESRVLTSPNHVKSKEKEEASIEILVNCRLLVACYQTTEAAHRKT